jgi:hypothetical protein
LLQIRNSDFLFLVVYRIGITNTGVQMSERFVTIICVRQPRKR